MRRESCGTFWLRWVGYFGRLGTSRRLRIDIDGSCRHSFRIFQEYMLETLRICPNPPYLAGNCVSWWQIVNEVSSVQRADPTCLVPRTITSAGDRCFASFIRTFCISAANGCHWRHQTFCQTAMMHFFRPDCRAWRLLYVHWIQMTLTYLLMSTIFT